MIEHIIPAMIVQLLVTLIVKSLAAGAVGACVWSISREITQAEYRWIEQFGGGIRANMPWWGGIDHRVWQTADPWLDWLLPSLIAIVIALLAHRRRTSRTH